MMKLLFCLLPLFLFGGIDECPVMYKGRVRPFKGTGTEWMEAHFGHSSLPEGKTSAEQVMVDVHFLGSDCIGHCPLFPIENHYLKNHLELPNERLASYQTILPKVKGDLLKDVVAYEFSESKSVKTGKKPQELTSLAEGLVVGRKGEEIVFHQVPDTYPWNQLHAGEFAKSTAHKRVQPAKNLIHKLNAFSLMNEEISPLEKGYMEMASQLISQGESPQTIAKELQKNYPDEIRLKAIFDPLKMLPSKRDPSDWISLKALLMQKYDPSTNSIKPLHNFTVFPDATYKLLQDEYIALHNEIQKTKKASVTDLGNRYGQKISKNIQHFGDELQKAYKPYQGRVFTLSNQGQFSYPTIAKLKVEAFYNSQPVIGTLMILYGFAFMLYFIGLIVKGPLFFRLGYAFTWLALLYHIAVLGMRMFILGRPPVATMYETLLYTPLIVTLSALIFYSKSRSKVLLFSSNALALVLLALSSLSGNAPALENVQPVLNSNWWLTIHVLMVVSSYGVFVLGGLLAHIVLIANKEWTKALIPPIVTSLYLGVILLVSGTLLGGMWASQSWGRFWDWDPKESWAFISSLVFIAIIHLNRYKKIETFGLCFGYILGLMTITFTWYGVNYILSTGLHSYGFSSGGSLYYITYLVLETLFCAIIAILHLTTKRKIEINHHKK